MAGVKTFLVLFLVTSCAVSINGQLKYKYYQNSCPQAETLITAAVTNAYNADNSIIAGLIRLMFHDCFVRGCDGSVLLDGPDTEKLGAPNANSLRGFGVIDAAKAAVEAVCPATVSCADIVAYAARDSINLGGGNIPFGYWLGGRKDGSVSISSETLTELPAPFLNYNQLVAAFAAKNLTTTEMIILSGAHTVGRAHCATILSRLYNFQGTGAADPAINKAYLPKLVAACPSASPGNLINMEMITPTKIDINYINDVLNGRGLFESDNALQTTSQGKSTLILEDTNFVFTNAFSLAMVKMSKTQVKLGSAGNIRVNCNTTAGAVPGP